MNGLRIALALGLAGAGAATAPAQPQQAAPSHSVAEVRRLERAWLDAYEKSDAAAMERILADDFLITFPGGRQSNKAETLAQVARSAGRVPRFATTEVGGRQFGETVVLTGTLITTSSRGESRSRYTDTWVNIGGRWQVAASHLASPETPATVSR
jgi:ketosteroid isomerase-like protein